MSALYPQNIAAKPADINKLCMLASPTSADTPLDPTYEDFRMQSQGG